MSHWGEFFQYKPTPPLDVKGGIKAQSKRGAFASKWWGKRWIQALESFRIDARLQRGRAYARRGQVADLKIGEGQISARVQGTRRTPYEVVIQMKTFSPGEWERVAAALAESPAHMARLLRGEMPEDIEAVFAESGLSLFPAEEGDLETECSCPDWSNPCKHIAAVHYLLAEAFDRDPFLLFKLRGIERESLVELVLGASGECEVDQGDDSDSSTPEPLPTDTDCFWGRVGITPIETEEVSPPAVSGALLKRLGGFPFWRGSEDFQESLVAVYRVASESVSNRYPVL
ncbi:MAG: SWIM zinc finger family protein [Dehalococcoidia bacterium]